MHFRSTNRADVSKNDNFTLWCGCVPTITSFQMCFVGIVIAKSVSICARARNVHVQPSLACTKVKWIVDDVILNNCINYINASTRIRTRSFVDSLDAKHLDAKPCWWWRKHAENPFGSNRFNIRCGRCTDYISLCLSSSSQRTIPICDRLDVDVDDKAFEHKFTCFFVAHAHPRDTRTRETVETNSVIFYI